MTLNPAGERVDYRDHFEDRWDVGPRNRRAPTRTLLGREEQNFAAGYAAYLMGKAEAAGESIDCRPEAPIGVALAARTVVHAGAFRPGAVRITGHDLDEIFPSLNAAGRSLFWWHRGQTGSAAWTRRLERAGYAIERLT